MVDFRINRMVVQWENAGSSAVAEYQVYRFENYDPQNTLKMVGIVRQNKSTPSRVVYYDTTVLPSHTYTYFVTAKDAFGNQSANSRMPAAVTTDVKFRGGPSS